MPVRLAVEALVGVRGLSREEVRRPLAELEVSRAVVNEPSLGIPTSKHYGRRAQTSLAKPYLGYSSSHRVLLIYLMCLESLVNGTCFGNGSTDTHQSTRALRSGIEQVIKG